MSLVLDLLFPKSCYQCQTSGSYLCSSCREKIVYRPIKHSSGSRFEGRLSLFRYHQSIKDMLTDLKFNFVSDLTDVLAKYSSAAINSHYRNLLDYWQTEKYVLVPIPLHSSRQNWRGFNQSALLGYQISQILNIGYQSNLLIKSRSTAPQTSIKIKSQRRQNVLGSYHLNPQITQPPSNIILFDDVYTTGSTIKYAASVFPVNTRIWVLTIAG